MLLCHELVYYNQMKKTTLLSAIYHAAT